MKLSIALSLTLTLVTLLPLQSVYADGLIPARTPYITPSQVATAIPLSDTPVSIQATVSTNPSITAEQAQDLIQLMQSTIPRKVH